MNVAIFDVQTVDPHLENSLLLTALWVVIVIKHLGSSEIFLSGSQSGAVVEDLGAVDQVQFTITIQDVLRTHEGRNTELLGITDHLLGTVLRGLLESALVALSRVQLVQEVCVSVTVLEIVTEVGDLLSIGSVSQMVVEPSQE